MTKNTTNKTSKIMVGALVAAAALAVSGAGFAANVPAWMGRIQADTCVKMRLGMLNFDDCAPGSTNYGNVPISVNNDAAGVSVHASFTATNNGSESGCYDDNNCGRVWALNSDGSTYGTTSWACVETRNGQTKRGSMDALTVPQSGYAWIELKGTHSNGCGSKIKAVQY